MAILAGVPISTHLDGVRAKHLGEVVINGRYLLDAAKRTGSEGVIGKIRQRAAPWALEVRNLIRGVTKKSGHIESVGGAGDSLRVSQQVRIDEVGLGEDELVRGRGIEDVREVRQDDVGDRL